MIGYGRVTAPFSERVQCTDGTAHCLRISADKKPIAGELPTVQRMRHTITIDKTGGGGSHLRVTLKVYRVDQNGDAASTLTYNFDATTGASPAADAVCATLKDLIAAINATAGFTCFALHAPHALPLTHANWVDLSETDIPFIAHGGGLDVLARDVSAHQVTVNGVGSKYVAYRRIGMPEVRDNGSFLLLDVFNVALATSLLRVYRDSYDGGAESPLFERLTSTTPTKYIDDNKLEASVVNGPILVEVSDTNALENNVNLYVKIAASPLGSEL